MVTEHADVQGKAECEFETGLARSRQPRTTEHVAQLQCGVGWRTQLDLGIARAHSGGERETGASLGGKTSLRAPENGRLGYALAYTLGGSRPSGHGFSIENGELRGIVTAVHQDWRLHANLGWARERATRNNHAVWGLALQRKGAMGPLDLIAEVYRDAPGSPWVQTGVRWEFLPDRLYFDAALGVQTDRERARQASIGMTVSF